MLKNRALVVVGVAILGVAVAGLSIVVNAPAYSATFTVAPSLPVARGDLSNQSVYFVMTDRYANGDATNDLAGLTGAPVSQSGFDPTSPAYFHGGDFKGLTMHLPYIKSLGFTSLWVTPPVKGQYVQNGSADYHGYWGTDFTTIDPHLGSEADFSAFIDAAHKLGMKVILDIVVNHTADVITYQSGNYNYINTSTAPYKSCDGTSFNSINEAELSSFPKLCAANSFPNVPQVSPGLANVKSPAFLNDLTNYHNRGNIDFGDSSTYLDGDFYGLDDLFTEKPAVLQGEIDLWSSWITRFNIDGFRIDTVPYVNPGFWQKFIPAILKVAHAHGHATFPIFGEVSFSDPSQTSAFVTEQGLPSVLDFPLQAVASQYVINSGTGMQMADFFNTDDYYTTATSSAYGLATFMGNHDMGRIGSTIYKVDQFYGDQVVLQRDELSDALLFLLRGGPILYYGDEKGMAGTGGDQAARQDMFPTQVSDWQTQYRIGGSPIGSQSAFDVHNPLEDVVKALEDTSTKYPALRSGTQQVRFGDDSVFAVSRYSGRQEFLVAFNTGVKAETFTSPISTVSSTWSAVSGAAQGISATAHALTLTLPAMGWVVLKAAKQFTPAISAKKLSITLSAPTVDFNTAHWLGVSATVPGDDFETVTFSSRLLGKPWTSLGSTDHRTFAAPEVPSGLFRTYIHQQRYRAGTLIQLVATVKDALGRVAVSKIINYKVSYSG